MYTCWKVHSMEDELDYKVQEKSNKHVLSPYYVQGIHTLSFNLMMCVVLFLFNQTRKLGCKAQGYRAIKWQNHCSNPVSLTVTKLPPQHGAINLRGNNSRPPNFPLKFSLSPNTREKVWPSPGWDGGDTGNQMPLARLFPHSEVLWFYFWKLEEAIVPVLDGFPHRKL